METTNETERWQQVVAQINSGRPMSPNQIRSSADALSDLIRTQPDVSTILREFNMLPTSTVGRSIVGKALGDCLTEIPSEKASPLVGVGPATAPARFESLEGEFASWSVYKIANKIL